MTRPLPAAPAALPVLLAMLFVLAPALVPGQAVAQTDLSVCRYLPRHRPAADVEFKPGVDVNGRPVAPADLPGSAGTAAPLRLDIPVTLDFARRIGLVVPPTGLPGRTEVGRLTMDGGQLFFNGQPLGGPSESQLYALCRTVQ